MNATKLRYVLVIVVFLGWHAGAFAQEDKKLGEVIWKREVSAGYNYASGNTRTNQLNASFIINKNRYHIDEITLKGNLYYSSSLGFC